jgi:SAM-dependent methyltransferase
MIEAARRKARAAEAVNVTWHVLPAGQMSELTHDDGPATFDGAYASFGALNCEPRLDQVAAVLAHLLRPGAALVCSVMNRWCAWEIAWGLLHLRPGQACRRLKLGWVPAGLASPEGHLSVPTRYYSPQAFARRFAPHFRIQRLRGLPVLLPPPYLDTSFERHRALFDRVEAIERCLRDRFPFYALGDHFLIVMVRAATEKGP